MMKAALYTEYGLPDVLQFKEIERPTPKEDEVLVKVRATSLNSSDWEFLRGQPLYTRMWGLRRPNNPILGSDIAGEVVAVGAQVTRFKVGDAVFGDVLGRGGGLAEYACLPTNILTHKPDSITFEQAAAIPQAGLVALQGLRDTGRLQRGETVLINGAGGGAGTFAIQLAKLWGAEVTAVDSGMKLEMMRSLGADHVVDYQQEDFTTRGVQYDMVLNFVTYRPLSAYRRTLNRTGRYVVVGGTIRSMLQTGLWGAVVTRTSPQQIGILAHETNVKDLNHMVALVEAGTVKPMIEKTYPLSAAADALRHVGEGRTLGKVVVIP